MAVYTVTITNAASPDTVTVSSASTPDVVSLTDGTTFAALEVSAGRGPKGDGFTGGSYNASTGVVTFTSNDGIGFSTGDLRGDLSEPGPIGDVTPNTGAFTSITAATADINGGTIDGTVIGGTTPAAGNFTTGSFTGNATFGDNDKAIFGAGSDLQIYHDGTHSYIDDQGTGNLRIRGSNAVQLQNAAGENYLFGNTDASVTIYYDNSPKLVTTNTGVDVTGTITSDGLTVQSGIADIQVGNLASGNAAVNIGRDDTSISGGNPLGYVQFLGSDNAAGSLTPHAYVKAVASGGHSAASNPTNIVIGTTAGSSTTIVDNFTFGASGDLTVANGNLIIGTSGNGINFSATSGTGTSELLDDYEEGTFTLTTDSDATGALSVNSGRYRKVGNIVTVNIALNVSTNFTNSSISGLPFLPQAEGAVSGMFVVAFNGTGNLFCQINDNNARVYFRGSSDVFDTRSPATSWGATTITFTYTTE